MRTWCSVDPAATTSRPPSPRSAPYLTDLRESTRGRGEDPPQGRSRASPRATSFVINNTDLAPYVGADLGLMEADNQRCRKQRPLRDDQPEAAPECRGSLIHRERGNAPPPESQAAGVPVPGAFLYSPIARLRGADHRVASRRHRYQPSTPCGEALPGSLDPRFRPEPASPPLDGSDESSAAPGPTGLRGRKPISPRAGIPRSRKKRTTARKSSPPGRVRRMPKFPASPPSHRLCGRCTRSTPGNCRLQSSTTMPSRTPMARPGRALAAVAMRTNACANAGQCRGMHRGGVERRTASICYRDREMGPHLLSVLHTSSDGSFVTVSETRPERG